MHSANPIILILGPTAAGKTRVAIELARGLPGGGECISADSMQVYRGMDIGTAKPTAAERAEVPHHLLDIVEPSDETFSVDQWLRLAEQCITDIRARSGGGKWPIVVGGTNLYVQALLHGMMDGPQPDPALRQRLLDLEQDQRRAWLLRVDPQSAERIHPNDIKRTIRAIEVFESSGRPISELQQQWTAARTRRDVFIVGLELSVEAINRRINDRVRQMIEAGLVEEVRGLLASGRLGRQAREGLGYKQLADAIETGGSLEDAIEQVKIRTRRFAKQQRSWLRRFRTISPSIWIDASEISPQSVAAQAVTAISAGGSSPAISEPQTLE